MNRCLWPCQSLVVEVGKVAMREVPNLKSIRNEDLRARYSLELVGDDLTNLGVGLCSLP